MAEWVLRVAARFELRHREMGWMITGGRVGEEIIVDCSGLWEVTSCVT